VRPSPPAPDGRLLPGPASPARPGGEDRPEGSALRRTPLPELLTAPLAAVPASLGALSRRGKTAACAGTALALVGLGGVTAAATTSLAAPASAGIAAAAPALAAEQATGVPLALGGGLGRLAPAAAARSSAAHAARHGLTAAPAAQHAAAHAAVKSWKQVRDELARKMDPHAAPGKLPLADRLVIGPASGTQSALPMTPSRLANATAIVRTTLSKRMGLRAAVIAVATAMQESGLENISYGDRDSLGLFQQRPSMGWGTASQLTTPAYAAGAFLGALATYQHADPGWAGQPLWKTAQSVQRSGFPYAYAKWEQQAAQLVSAIAMKLG
jgi:hypothetical protein